MTKLTLIPKIALAAALTMGALSLPTPSQASGCLSFPVCPDYYRPVICSNGVVYTNSCFAARACEEECQPFGDWGME